MTKILSNAVNRLDNFEQKMCIYGVVIHEIVERKVNGNEPLIVKAQPFIDIYISSFILVLWALCFRCHSSKNALLIVHSHKTLMTMKTL